jgi:hypothetical protein
VETFTTTIARAADPSPPKGTTPLRLHPKLGNRARSVNGSIQDVIEQIDRTIKSLPQN